MQRWLIDSRRKNLIWSGSYQRWRRIITYLIVYLLVLYKLMLKGSSLLILPKYKYDINRLKKSLRRYKKFRKGKYVDILSYWNVSGKRVYNAIHKSMLRYGPYLEKWTWIEESLNYHWIYIVWEYDKNWLPIEFNWNMRKNSRYAGFKYRRKKQ